MFFNQTTFIGVDPTAGQRPFVFVALDSDLRLLAISQGQLEDVLAFCGGQRQAVVGVCAPRRPNQGLLQRDDVRRRLQPAPRPGRWENFRLVEYLLRQYNIFAPQTRNRAEDCPSWMQMSFRLFDRLDHLGYDNYPADESVLQTVEVYPYGAYAALLGVQPFPKHTLEGRLQRQLALHDRKLQIPDPMRLFEEITRYKVLSGNLPVDDILYSPEELDALAAAYTAWLALREPEAVCALGDPEEGQVIMPVAELEPLP
ncbi:MAG TPA: DUF429 domain-containing protein [Anaerolineales bacterium]|nr:DUF429 domain-containing protein [Anaerolineales bacterium]